MKRAAAAGLAGLLLLSAGCGFHLAGTGSTLDPRIKVIAVPAFENRTDIDRVVIILTDAVMNEFVRRGRYTLVSDPSKADAVLEGTITEISLRTTEVDDQGRATRSIVAITMDVRFRNRIADRITWSNPSFTYTEEFDMAEASTEYVQQEVLAVERLSQDIASSLVSSVVEGF